MKDDGSVLESPEGKVLKRKVIPKKKIVDEQGGEWEVVDQRKTMIVEESDDSRSESDDGSQMTFEKK